MVRPSNHRILLIGDAQHEIHNVLLQALPTMQVTAAPTVFDGIAELSTGEGYSAVLAAIEPMERRPEAAVRVLRELTGDGRLILFGHPTLELLSRKMLEFGCDDYLVSPPSSAELQQIFSRPTLKLAGSDDEPGDRNPAAAPPADHPQTSERDGAPRNLAPRDALESVDSLPLAELMLDALVTCPHDAARAAAQAVNAHLGNQLEVVYTAPGKPAPLPASSTSNPPLSGDERLVLSHGLRDGNEDVGTLHLLVSPREDEAAARHWLSHLCGVFSKLASLQERHNRLQRLAITDELTGLYNGRYFRHFLTRITERARQMRFPVTLLLFDIDDFKKYNDEFGHGVGDEILKQTAALMKRCCRDHDLVARIGGDEFAVVFWDKEGPRQPRDPKTGDPRPGVSYRPPQTPVQVFERFRKLMNEKDFTGLGATGRGTLGISAGLAVFPYDAQDVPALIKRADERLMFGAKASGKNSLYLVGGQDDPSQV